MEVKLGYMDLECFMGPNNNMVSFSLVSVRC